jgi:hypothetical protein
MMLEWLSERTGRMGDALLARVAPKLNAHAACGGWKYCCGIKDGSAYGGQWRVDPEHDGYCTYCEQLFWDC